MAAPLDPPTSPVESPHRHRNVWFGAVSALLAGLCWTLVMSSEAFSHGILAGAVVVILVLSFIAGIIGVKKGLASKILSILGLVMALFMALVWLLARASSSGS